MSHPILVTGAAGFIGFHMALRLLKNGQRVVGLDNMNDYYDVKLKEDRLKKLETYENFTLYRADLADFNALQAMWSEAGPFHDVIHLAAQAGVRYSLENPHAYISSNIVGHVNILELCRHTENFRHLVYASSSSVYGSNKKLPYAVEDRVDNPISLYAATKKSDELISHSYSHLYQIPQTGLRFFTVYGPWGRPDMAPIIFSDAITKGEKVPVFNNGEMKRDFTYIDDIIDGVLGALENPPIAENGNAPCRVLNIGNSRSENLMDFIAELEKALGQKADINFLPMQPGDVLETYADVSETTKITGFQAKTPIQDGIPRFIEWYKAYYQQ